MSRIKVTLLEVKDLGDPYEYDDDYWEKQKPKKEERQKIETKKSRFEKQPDVGTEAKWD